MLGKNPPETPSKFIQEMSLTSPKNSRPAPLSPAAFQDIVEDEVSSPIEPLLVENNKRFVLFPIQYNQIWSFYKNALANFWTAEEIELAHDFDDWDSLPQKEKVCILHSLSVLSMNELVLYDDPVLSKISDDIQIPEARCFIGYQMMQRSIHSEVVHVLIDLLQPDQSERDLVFKTVENCIRPLTLVSSKLKRLAWIQKNITESSSPFPVRLFALGVYAVIVNSSVNAILLHFTEEKRFAGVLRILGKRMCDNTRFLEFVYLLISKHCVGVVPVAIASTILAEAMAVEYATLQNVLALCGDISVKSIPCRSFIGCCANMICDKFKLPKTWSIEQGAVLFESLQKVVKVERGIDEKMTMNANAGQEKMTTRDEFCLDEDF